MTIISILYAGEEKVKKCIYVRYRNEYHGMSQALKRFRRFLYDETEFLSLGYKKLSWA